MFIPVLSSLLELLLLLDVPHRYFTFIIEKRRPVKEANSSIP